ncbi:fasciclin domain-containing protein [Dyadobacter subterraneus]|uniref:Fasciclin domain-containing protein n=1 Tax=Dyadobacter subterraneus TaxID=2773304 RepID=A0ABR9WIK0_9BACT|nr:fasciclin domain-containing protein [Dyadobacter subterraneus]MBE9465322.1 fasciclin domain-containing protein [Dyadobacter subterraneus]
MKKINFISRYAAFFLIVTLITGIVTSCTEKDSDIVKPKTITDVILQNSEFSTLREIILGLDMADALRTENLTLFAPNNSAFIASGITSAAINSMNKDSARAFVYRHLLGTRYEYASLPLGVNKGLDKRYTITITKSTTSDSTVYLNNDKSIIIITKNVNADNGVIQVVSRTLAKIK